MGTWPIPEDWIQSVLKLRNSGSIDCMWTEWDGECEHLYDTHDKNPQI